MKNSVVKTLLNIVLYKNLKNFTLQKDGSNG